MANTKSAKLMAGKIARRTETNRRRRQEMRSAVRKVELALEKGEGEAGKLLQQAQPLLMRAAARGILHKNAASRKVSRLAKRVQAST